MDILSEAESRSFSQFLDTFSSTTAPAPASDPNVFPPPSGQRTRHASEKLAGLSRIDAAGEAAPLGGWAEKATGGGGAGPSTEGPMLSSGRRYSSHERDDAATATAMSGFGYGARQLPPPPHLAFTGPSSFPPTPHPHPNADFPLPPPSSLSTLSTQPRASTFRHQIYCTPTVSTSSSVLLSSLAYPAPPLSSTYLSTSLYPHYPPPPPLSPDSQAEQKRARMAQQADELEAMLRTTTESGRVAYDPSRSLSRGMSGIKGLGKEPKAGVEEEENEDGPPLKRTKSDEAVPGKQVNPLAVMLEAEQRVGPRTSRISKRSQQQGDFAPFSPPIRAPPAQDQHPPSPPHPRSAAKRKAPAPRKSRPSSKAAAVAIDPEDSASPPVASTSSSLFPFPTPPNIPFAPRRSSRPPSTTATARKPSPSSASPPPPPAGTKPALLTAAQKKANHIASEQKRRAAIRAGYDGLCEVVPSLRAAVEEYEERLAAVSGAGAGVGRGGKKGRTGRGRSGESTTGALMGGIEVGGEKVDGRAGPKSEAVVLSKTVEHLRTLLSTRQTLLTRLSDGYSTASAQSISLPPPTPAGYLGTKQVAGEWDEMWEDGWMESEVLSMLGLPVKDEEVEVKEEEELEELDEDVPGA